MRTKERGEHVKHPRGERAFLGVIGIRGSRVVASSGCQGLVSEEETAQAFVEEVFLGFGERG